MKPSKILVKSDNRESPYDYQFKLADLELSHFRPNKKPYEDIADADFYDIQTYDRPYPSQFQCVSLTTQCTDAPECYRFDSFLQTAKLQVKQSVDNWFLDCVFSEAVV